MNQKNNNEKEKNSSVLVLLSGGVDSSASVQYYISRNYHVNSIIFNYGQPSFKQELNAAKKICNYYNIKLFEVNLGYSIQDKKGEFLGRNALLILSSCSFLNRNQNFISIGIHSGTAFYDSGPAFIKVMQDLLDGYFGGVVRITTPFLEYSKLQVYQYAVREKVPVDMTYSCEIGEEQPCGICQSCIDRRLLNELLSSEN